MCLLKLELVYSNSLLLTLSKYQIIVATYFCSYII